MMTVSRNPDAAIKTATTVLQIKSDNMFITVEDLHSSYLLAAIAIHNPEESK